MSSVEVIKFEQPDKNIPIEFFRIEDSVDLFDYNYHYQYNFYQIFWFTEADQQVQEIDCVQYTIEANQIWITYPGQIQYFNPTGIKGYFLAIDKDYFNHILHMQMDPSVFGDHAPLLFHLPEVKHMLFQSILQLFELEWNADKRTFLLEQYLAIFLTHIQDLVLLSQVNERYDVRTNKLLALVEEHYAEQWAAHQYAAEIGLSVKRMNEVLVQTTSATVTQHVHRRLLLESQRLLGYSKRHVQEIALDLGFSEVNYFNRFFKKHMHVSPLAYRKKVQNSPIIGDK